MADSDALIEALRGREPVPADDPLATALAGWTTDIDRDLPPVEPLAPVLTSRIAGGPRARASVAAVLATGLVLASGVVAAQRAQPGGVLWGVSRLLDPVRATSLEARAEADQSLAAAADDLVAQRYDQARTRLAAARGQLAQVRPVDGRDALDLRALALQRELYAAVGDSSGVSTQPAQTSGPARPSVAPSPPTTLSTPDPPTTTPAPSGGKSRRPVTPGEPVLPPPPVPTAPTGQPTQTDPAYTDPSQRPGRARWPKRDRAHDRGERAGDRTHQKDKKAKNGRPGRAHHKHKRPRFR